MHVGEWIKEHPWESAAIGGGVGLLLILWWASGSSASNGTSASGLDSYYAAEAAAAQGGDQLAALNDQYNAEANIAATGAGVANAQTAAGVQTAQINANAATAADAAAVQEAQIAANETVATTQSNNRAAVTVAGYQAYTAPIENAQNQGYTEKAIANLLSYMPPPPGANPGNYASTGAAPSPQSVADTLATLKTPKLRQAYLQQVAGTGVS